jgi:hypothetical protein
MCCCQKNVPTGQDNAGHCGCQEESSCGCQGGCRCGCRSGCGCQSERACSSGCNCQSGGGTGCDCQSGCGCGSRECGTGEKHAKFQRSFPTKAEMIARLEAYLAELKAEVQGVEERIKDLRG